MTINSSSIPALTIARKLRRKKRAEGGRLWGDVGAAMPEAYGADSPIRDPLYTVPKSLLYDLPKKAIEQARENPLPGLRREDYTDLPPDTTPDPKSALGGIGVAAPRVGWQPVDPMVGSSLEAASNVMGGTALSAPAARAGEVIAGAGPVRRVAGEVAAEAPHPTQTPQFKDWFGDSKVLNEAGQPLVVYHGTKSNFDEFSLASAGSNNDPGMWGTGFYFSPNSKMSEAYGDRIVPSYVSLKNPLIVRQASRLPQELRPVAGDTEKSKRLREILISRGYDGVMQYETGDKIKLSQVVAFHPNQIKSAIGNSGEFNSRNASILGSGATDKRAAGLAAADEALEAERRLGATHEPRPAAAPEPAAATDPAAVGPGGGGPSGARSLDEAQATAARWAGDRRPLEGIPGPLKIGDDHFVPGPIGKVHDVAEEYMRTHRPEIEYTPATKYHPIDPEHSQAIAQAYDDMKHSPKDPATKASYDALIDETTKQYQTIKKSGLKIEPIPAGAPDPYAQNPRLAARDVAENNHLWFFPTEGGFGTVNKITDNPMLRKTGEKIGDHEMLANDMFRVVHDYFGHLQHGHGFRAAGEDNAWRSHSAMYSDLARPAMTTETRGQNSNVNFSSTPLYKAIGEAKARELYGNEGRTTGAKAGLPQRSGVQDSQSVPGLQPMARDDGSLLQSQESKLGELRGERDNGSSGHADLARVSGRDGVASDRETSDRPLPRQQRPLRDGERPLGDSSAKLHQSASQYSDHVRGENPRDVGVGEGNGDTPAHALGSPEQVRVDRGAGTDASQVEPRWKTITVGEHNRKASGADTIYADQKVGLMPDWTMYNRGEEPIYAYHGSPHSFDRFDMNKIGSGEGAQVYGHGLYFAENPKVAKAYREQLSKHGAWEMNGEKVPSSHVDDLMVRAVDNAGAKFTDPEGAPKFIDRHQFTGDIVNTIAGQMERGKTVAQIRKRPPEFADDWHRTAWNAALDVLDQVKVTHAKNPGHTYKVGIEGDPQHFLDWDATLKDQPPHIRERVQKDMEDSVANQKVALQRSIEKARDELDRSMNGTSRTHQGRSISPRAPYRIRSDIEDMERRLAALDPNTLPGKDIYKRMGLPAKDPEEMGRKATSALLSRGIPGVRYFDQGSRNLAQGAKSRNYVAFDDKTIRILRKYGVVGIPAAGVLGADGEERRARGGRAAKRVARKAGGGGAFGVLSPAELAEAEPPPKIEIGGPRDQSGENIRYRTPNGVNISDEDIDRATHVGLSATTGPVSRIADDTGAAMQIARKLREQRYAEPEFTPGGSRIINKGVENPTDPSIQTVADPHRMMFPGIYRDPRIIAEEAASRVGPEDPAMKQLFGVTRGDLREMAQGRVGNEEPNLRLKKNPSGSRSAQNIQTPQNTQRLIDILHEGGQHEGLRTADAWYIMDPVYKRMEQMFGPEEAVKRYRAFNTTTAMASPGSDVMTEIQRGTGAHWLQNQGRFDDFMKYAGIADDMRYRHPIPGDMKYIGGHPYHRTAQGEPMAKFFEHGSIQSDKPKVPLYAHASGVPETGFQTTGPVGDAHFSRGVGLSDTRKGPSNVAGSFQTPEYQTLQPWWQHDVAGQVGLESVPAQARLWTTLGPQTGVESELGAPKLELLAKQIMVAAKRLRISPEQARDLILSGQAGAGMLGGAMAAPAVMDAMRERAAGGSVNSAMQVARQIKRAKGGKVHLGPIIGETGGRADKVPMEVPDGSYVLTADHCSAMGEGNTLAGFEKLKKMFPKSVAAYKAAKARGPVARASGGRVPILAADGEFVVCPEDITDRWGDLDKGHKVLDHWQTTERKNHIETLKGLAPPAQD